MKLYEILTINPGSTSTKVAYFQGEKCLFSKNISHAASELAKFDQLSDQLIYRRDQIIEALNDGDIDLKEVDAVVGRGGGLVSMEGGTYAITDLILDHARNRANGIIHPASLGPQLAHEFAQLHGVNSYVVNPPDVDELQDLARMTGLKDTYRVVHLHALNLKETAIRHSKNVKKARYEDSNYIVCHIGGGISISAHRKGKMIDGYDIVGGEGPMAPTRCGSISVANVLDYMEKNGAAISDVRKMCTSAGGFVDHLGNSNALEISENAKKGEPYCKMVWEAMIYQIEKGIGSMATVLKGDIDGILLGGGMVYNEALVSEIGKACEFLAPVYAYPGEFEMEAMASGAIRILSGEESVKEYSGKPIWEGFGF